MKTIELQIRTSHEQVGLKMSGVSKEDQSFVINHVFQFLRRKEAVEAPAAEKSEIQPFLKVNVQSKSTDYKQKAAEIIERAKQKQTQEEPKGSKPRQLPSIDWEHSEIVSVGEALQKALEAKKSDDEDVPEHWHTGIKIDDDGTKRYRCRYECPSCGDKGKRYISLGTESIQCRACEKELKVVAATGMWDPTGVPVRDSWGNYFMATTTMEKEDVLNGEE
jgi:ribosomal protein L37AE/L43A